MTAVRIELTREELLALIREGVRAELGRTKVDPPPAPAEDVPVTVTAEDYAELRAFRRRRGRRG